MTKEESRRFLQQLAQYQGQWVATRGTTVVANAARFSELENDPRVQPGDRIRPVSRRHQGPYLRR